jgi:hypothetical protein
MRVILFTDLNKHRIFYNNYLVFGNTKRLLKRDVIECLREDSMLEYGVYKTQSDIEACCFLYDWHRILRLKPEIAVYSGDTPLFGIKERSFADLHLQLRQRLSAYKKVQRCGTDER